MQTKKATQRLRGALALDGDTYAAIARTPGDLRGAVIVVVLATVLAGVGGILWTRWGGQPPARVIYETDTSRLWARSVIAGGAAQVGLWCVWVLVTALYLRSFGVRAAYGCLARVMGYAFAPIGLQAALAPPGLELAVALVAFGWTIAATVVGVEAATEAPRGQVVLSVLAGFTIFAVALSLLGNGDLDLAPGMFALDPLPISVGTRPLR